MIGFDEFGFALRDPAWLWLLPVIVLVLFARARRRPRLPIAGVALALPGTDLARELDLPPLPRSFRQQALALLPVLEALGLFAVVIALARPIERVPLPPEREGADVLLCLDVSSSMLSTDLGRAETTRLDVVRDAAADFARMRPGDRVGLVRFARYADLLCPPTLDHEAVAELLAGVEPVASEGPEDATGIGTALSFCIETLERATTTGRVVVLLTDGEENVATRATPHEIPPVHAGQLAAQRGVRVHTIVAGTGKPGQGGEIVPLDTTDVQQVAALTGGRFFRARDAESLQRIYREIDAIEKTRFAEPRVLVREWFALTAALGALCVMLAGYGRTLGPGELP